MDVEVFVTAGLGDSRYLLLSGDEAAVIDPQRDTWRSGMGHNPREPDPLRRRPPRPARHHTSRPHSVGHLLQRPPRPSSDLFLQRPDPVGVVTFRMHEIRPGWAPSKPRGRWCAPGQQ